MFRPIEIDGETVGYERRTSHAVFFFGTKNCSRERLAEIYPDLRFAFLKQVHGANVVWANPDVHAAADGHATVDRGLALVIQTADCLPVFLAGKDRAIGLHAGWRGLAARIVHSAADFIKGENLPFGAIGPHIARDSFEVGNEVADILRAVSHGDDAITLHPDPLKKYVDLRLIALRHLNLGFGTGLDVATLDADTFRSPLYHSYRRGKNRGERQFSFVALV